jgi:tetratricopeptide (TPR) repeat protein
MEPKSSTKPKPRTGRTWFLRLSLMVCVPTLLLGVAEGILRLAGYGHSSSFFVSSPHHGEGELIENARFAWRFLPPTLARASQPTRIQREKSPGTTRVFVFGESAAEGDPEPAFGMPRLLEVLLEGRFSGRDFEVINASVTAINSHAILPITRECAGLDGDFWVIYIGHNEVMGPFGAGTVFGQKTPPLAALRVGLSLKQFRLGQWIASFGNSSSGAESTQWKGMGMFLDQQLRATDPQLNWVYDSYKKNLSDVLAESRLAGVPVVLSTAASNLRDSAPFASLDAGGGGSAVEQFQLARSLEAEGKTGEARSHYIRARDLDVLRFRADSKLNAITQSLGQAESDNVIFIDAQTALDAQSPGGIAGREIFYEHVHFTFEGNYHLARLFSGEIASQLTSGGDKPGGQWLTSAECAERLAYTDWDRGVVLASVIRRLQQPPFNQRLNSDEAIGQLQAQLQRVAKRLDRTAALEAYSTALKARPNDWRLLQRRGLLLSSAGRHEEGVDSLKRALGQTPWSRILHYQLGAMQNKAGQFDDALSSLAGALKLKPDFPEAVQQLTRARAGIQYRLGEKEKAAGNAAGALAHYVKATELDDGFAEAHFQVGVCRVEAGRIAEATASFERAVALKPGLPQARFNLVTGLLRQARYSDALGHLEALASENPNDIQVQQYLQLTRSKLRETAKPQP